MISIYNPEELEIAVLEDPRDKVVFSGERGIMAHWLKNLFPSHNTFVSTHVVGAAEFLVKESGGPGKDILNCVSEESLNFFKTMREDPGKFCQRLYFLNNEIPSVENLERLSKSKTAVNRAVAHYYLDKNLAGSLGKTFKTRIASLEALAMRLLNVEIVQSSLEKLIAKYDSPKTLWYHEPPDHPEWLEGELDKVKGKVVVVAENHSVNLQYYKSWRREYPEVKIDGSHPKFIAWCNW